MNIVVRSLPEVVKKNLLESLAQLLRPVGFAKFDFYETGPTPIRLRGKIDVALWAGLKAVANAVRSIETGKRQSIWTENFICRAFKASERESE